MSAESALEGAPENRVRARRFEHSDARALIGWVPDAAAAELFAGDSSLWPLADETLRARLAEVGVEAWTALAEGSPAGHAQVLLGPAGVARIAWVLVDPERRGVGIAHTLLDAMLRDAAGRGVRLVYLHVVPGNASAVRTYARLDFVADGRCPAHPEYVLMVRGTAVDRAEVGADVPCLAHASSFGFDASR